ncbi:MAG: response regulator [Janthinobacterium lividum]
MDDDFIIRMHVTRILENAGFRVMDADTGDAGLALLEKHYLNFVLLFTDVQMPGHLDGFALARKAAAAWPHISIVVASGHAIPRPGAMPDKARFIGKPFSAELVHAHLQEILPDGQQPIPLKNSRHDQ